MFGYPSTVESVSKAAVSRDVRAKRSLTRERCWEIRQAFYRLHTTAIGNDEIFLLRRAPQVESSEEAARAGR